MSRRYDARTGRPLEGAREAVETLTDPELEVELLVAASAPGRMRVERLAKLLDERSRRRFKRQSPARLA